MDLLHDKIDHKNGGTHYYTVAKNCANLILFLMNDILDFAQFEQKKLLLNIETFKLETLLQQCISILKF